MWVQPGHDSICESSRGTTTLLPWSRTPGYDFLEENVIKFVPSLNCRWWSQKGPFLIVVKKLISWRKTNPVVLGIQVLVLERTYPTLSKTKDFILQWGLSPLQPQTRMKSLSPFILWLNFQLNWPWCIKSWLLLVLAEISSVHKSAPLGMKNQGPGRDMMPDILAVCHKSSPMSLETQWPG